MLKTKLRSYVRNWRRKRETKNLLKQNKYWLWWKLRGGMLFWSKVENFIGNHSIRGCDKTSGGSSPKRVRSAVVTSFKSSINHNGTRIDDWITVLHNFDGTEDEQRERFFFIVINLKWQNWPKDLKIVIKKKKNYLKRKTLGF